MKNLFRAIIILALATFCILLSAGVLMSEALPRMAANKFGPSDSGLSPLQRVMYSYRLLSNERNLLSGLDKQAAPREFQIVMGESVNSIAIRLEEERFITSAENFRTYLIYAGLDTQVQAGKYQLNSTMSPVAIAHQLLDPVPEDVEFNILPGWRAEEIAAALPTSGLSVTGAEFLDIVRNPPEEILPPGFPALPSLEGFLMPGSYQIKREISPTDLIILFLHRFDENVSQDLRDGFANQGLDLVQAVTLASIIQREAVVVDEQPLIASVFYNRIRIGMRLESDPTVQYALGYQLIEKKWWKNPLSGADLQFDSRYNTYVYPGFPPGPISNPALDALQSVVNPAQTDYFYFRAKCDGSGLHLFAITYDEHLNNGCP
jgi:UPF0755 protein